MCSILEALKANVSQMLKVKNWIGPSSTVLCVNDIQPKMRSNLTLREVVTFHTTFLTVRFLFLKQYMYFSIIFFLIEAALPLLNSMDNCWRKNFFERFSFKSFSGLSMNIFVSIKSGNGQQRQRYQVIDSLL